MTFETHTHRNNVVKTRHKPFWKGLNNLGQLTE